jgi:hypothetical protein
MKYRSRNIQATKRFSILKHIVNPVITYQVRPSILANKIDIMDINTYFNRAIKLIFKLPKYLPPSLIHLSLNIESSQSYVNRITYKTTNRFTVLWPKVCNL